jgi:dimethylaniline monooxygenase (N-oxide forming)
MASFSSLPMKEPPWEETYYDYFPARYVTQYLNEYVDKQVYQGRTIRDRIKFDTRVAKVGFSPAGNQWQMFCEGAHQPLVTANLVVAAGLTSQPNMPELPGQEAFQGTIRHHVDFSKSSILQDPGVKHVAVLGGAKSAADVAYAAAKAGKRVSWIVRRSGNGPAHFAPAKGAGPYKNSNELLYTRLTAALSPSIWNQQNWLSRALHCTRLGRKLVDWIWDRFNVNSRHEAGFGGGHVTEGSQNGFDNLEPDTS